LKSGIFNNKNQVKQVAVSKKVSADKYYQIAKPDEFLFTIKILIINSKVKLIIR